MHCHCDKRSDREILLSIERKLEKLIGEYEMDLYDRIIAGVLAQQSGDSATLAQHVAAIDSHLKNVDDEVLGLQSDDTSSASRLSAIEGGLAKIADAVNGPANPGGTPVANPGGDTSNPAPAADGSQSADVGPGADAPIPASGAGSETHGQVDTPVTTG